MPGAEISQEFALVRDFAIIMAVAGVTIVIFRKLNQPPILGYILAGLIVGPFTLPLFGIKSPVTNVHSIRLLADLGLVLLLFGLGLEFGWQRIRQMGIRVILIGAIEISLMIAIGFEVGTLLGWSVKEAVFLGAALSISSSAIIIKVLHDTGSLFKPHGKLIVGILVVEDFAAVLLLSLLSGVISTGSATPGDIGGLFVKLTLFFISALGLGALFAPRIVNFVAKFQSHETLLIVSLALCFGLALLAEQLGISAAAGAFIIGTVLGDTSHSKELSRTMGPVRDIFAALFFVSVGMLIDITIIDDFILPALVVSVVFITAKVVLTTVATFVIGHEGRIALKVGMGTPQLGEFSLAIIKVGADHSAIGAFLYPVTVVTAAITSFVYPFIFRSAGATSILIHRKSPNLLKNYVGILSHWLISIRTVLSIKGPITTKIRHSSKVILINFSIIAVLIGVATFLLRFVPELSEVIKLHESILALVISAGVLTLCVPSAVFIWKSLQTITDNLSSAILGRSFIVSSPSLWGKSNLHSLIRDSILMLMVGLLLIWSLPFLSQLLFLGTFSAPVPIILIAVLCVLTWRKSSEIHNLLHLTFSRTFLGEFPTDTDVDVDAKKDKQFDRQLHLF